MAEEEVQAEVETEEKETEQEELSDLEKHERELLEQEDAEKETEEAAEKETEQEAEEIDWDELREKHPQIDKLGIKNMGELVEKYFGGLEDFQRDSGIVKQLKELGFETEAERSELFKKLAAKEEIKPGEKREETDKTFAEQRRDRLAPFVHQYVTDQETGELREATEEEKKSQHDNLDNLANAIVPAELPDTVDRVEVVTTNLRDDLAWALFRLQPILEKHKEEIISDDTRAEILEHSKKFPKTYSEIVQNALEKGENFYSAVYHHFITMTQKEKIDAEQKKRWEEEREKEEKKKKDAKVESAKKRGEIATSEKSWKDMTLPEKEAELRRQEAEGE